MGRRAAADAPLALVGTSTATTYRFRAASGFGWACCTVNDETGELCITSDWGNWSHRWSADPKHLGAPSLTHFLGGRDNVDYVARKLQREGRLGERFSPAKTVTAIRRALAERRRDHGRVELAQRLDTARDDLSWPRGIIVRGIVHLRPDPVLTRELARELWDDLGDIEDCTSGDLFFARLPDRLHDFISCLWEYSRTEQTPEDRALREIVLPPLLEACRAEAARRRDSTPFKEQP